MPDVVAVNYEVQYWWYEIYETIKKVRHINTSAHVHLYIRPADILSAFSCTLHAWSLCYKTVSIFLCFDLSSKLFLCLLLANVIWPSLTNDMIILRRNGVPADGSVSCQFRGPGCSSSVQTLGEQQTGHHASLLCPCPDDDNFLLHHALHHAKLQ